MDENKNNPDVTSKSIFARKPLLTISIALFALLAAYFCLAFFVWDISIVSEKGDEIIWEYGDPWQTPEITCKTTHRFLPLLDAPLEFTEIGEVPPDKLGDFELTYRAAKGGRHADMRIKVRVVDTKGPEITLVKNPDGYTLPGHEYQEEGFTAVDLFDGDLTSAVERTASPEKIIYTVKDSHGNVTTVERVIAYDDRTAPVFDLLGMAEINWPLGVPYKDLSVFATDDAEGDVSGKISVSGAVDVSSPGDYVLTYSVSDNYNNKATATRTVHVLSSLPSSGRYVYLTFDDGPSGYTARLLDILDKYNVRATFFVTGAAPGYAYLIGEAARRGHTIAAHTYSHDYAKIYASEAAYWEDFERIQSLIEQQTGSRTNLVRFPGGSSNTVSANYSKGIMTQLTNQMTEKGYVYFDWNVSSGDGGSASTRDSVYRNITNGIQNTSYAIVLCHDTKGGTIDAIEDVIIYCLANGYTLLPLTSGSSPVHHGVVN